MIVGTYLKQIMIIKRISKNINVKVAHKLVIATSKHDVAVAVSQFAIYHCYSYINSAIKELTPSKFLQK